MYSRGWDALEYIFLPLKNVLKGVGRPCVHFFALVKMYSRGWDALAYIFFAFVFLCFSCFFPRYPFSCHVVPVPLFRPSLTCVYEKQLFLDTFCWKKHCIGNVRHAKVHFPKKCSFYVFLVFLLFFYQYLFSCHVVPVPMFRPSLTCVYEKQLCLDTFCWKKHCIGNVRHAKVHFPKKCSFWVLLVFLMFFSRYPFSCHVVPFPLFRPSLTCVYEKQLCLDTFCWKKHCIGNVRHAKVHFPKKNVCSMSFSCFSCLFFSVPVLVPCCSVSVVPATVNSCLWKTTISWYYFAEKNIVSATSDMRKYIFPKKMLVLYLSRVYRIFFLGTHSRLMVHFSYRLILCLVLLGFSCLMFFPFFCSLSISFCVFLVFLVFFSRYPFSCQVVPFPLFRPSLTCVYEKKSIFWYFLLKKTLYRQRQTCFSTFFPKNGLNTSKMYRYIFDVLPPKCTGTFLTYQNGLNVQYIFGGPPPLRGGDVYILFYFISEIMT